MNIINAVTNGGYYMWGGNEGESKSEEESEEILTPKHLTN